LQYNPEIKCCILQSQISVTTDEVRVSLLWKTKKG